MPGQSAPPSPFGTAPERPRPAQSSAAGPVPGAGPWYRQVRFTLPIGTVAGIALGAVAAGASPATSTPTVTAASTAATAAAAPPATTTVTETAPTVTTTVTTTIPARKGGHVQAVLDAWTNAGPLPDKQAQAMRRLLQEWPTLAQALESATGVKVPKAGAARPATSTTSPKTSPPSPSPYYANCAAARTAGAAPIYAGQPGYRAGLDRDGDGVACE